MFKSQNKSEFKTVEFEKTKLLIPKNYTIKKLLAKTLQGSIYVGENTTKKEKIIIKIANKTLHKNGLALHAGEYVPIHEDILKEISIMKHITTETHKKNNKTKSLNKTSNGFVKLIKSYDDDKYYYVIQSFGGVNMFDYIANQHILIKTNKLKLSKHKENIKKYFAQLIKTFDLFHNKLNVVHLDISLENLLFDESKGWINVCDFGLSEMNLKNKKMKKYVGKSNYMAPEIANKTPFNAKSADVWSLGVCLYMMWFGLPAYKYAKFSDPYFTNIWNGYLTEMIKGYGMNAYLDDDICDLFDKIFVNEKNRYNIKDIMNHKFFKDVEFNSL